MSFCCCLFYVNFTKTKLNIEKNKGCPCATSSTRVTFFKNTRGKGRIVQVNPGLVSLGYVGLGLFTLVQIARFLSGY